MATGSADAGVSGDSDGGGWRVLLCCTGSVASLKVPQLCRALLEDARVQLRVVSTQHALHFFSPSQLPPAARLYTDEDEWNAWTGRGDPVLHIELRNWADLLLVAPLDANTLAKLATGLADNLVTCVARAWPVGRKLVLVCPAMNTQMWQHPVTAPQLHTLTSWGYTVLAPVQKTLVCGETGVGAMAEVGDICGAVWELLAVPPEHTNTAGTE